jgi:hypothetical protein
MDHVVFLDAKSKELENLVTGNKTMIIRGSDGKNLPYGLIKQGDILYFINNNGEGEVKARGVVSSVYNSEKLSVEESFKTIIDHQDKLQLPDIQFEQLAGKKFLVLIGLDKIEEVNPFNIDKNNLTYTADWIPVGKIELCRI